jgi:hypothetical protein
VLGCIFLLVWTLDAGDNKQRWIANPPQPGDAELYDLELTLQARKVLEPLAAPKVAVSVRNRFVTLWGCAPTREVARRAEDRVRQVVGVAGVINELHIKSGESDSLMLAWANPVARPPLADPIVAEKPHRQENLVWRPVVPELEAIGPAPPSLAGVRSEAEKDRLSRTRSTLVASWPAQKEQKPLGAPPAPPPSLANAVEELRLADQRFQNLRADVSDGTIRLSGSIYRMEHVFELAKTLARLPGVKRVLFDQVKPEYTP